MDFISLSKTALFRGTTPQETEKMLSCLGAEQRHFSKGEMICRTGDIVTALGMVLTGSVLIENNDLWGNTTVLDSVGPGQIFAETYACTSGEPLMVNVVAAEPVDVLFLNMDRVLQVCSHACTHHNRLIRNLLSISAQKNLNLSRKIFTPPPNPSEGGCLPICPTRPSAAEATASPSPLTASSWPTTSMWTGARCPTS